MWQSQRNNIKRGYKPTQYTHATKDAHTSNNSIGEQLLIQATNGKQANKTILVVDDDKDIVSAIETILTMVGYSVTRAYTGAECLTAVKAQKPDLVLLDLMLPDMNGKQVAEQLRSQAQFDETPIILISAAREAKEVAQAMSAKACIEKPFELDELVNTVQKHVAA